MRFAFNDLAGNAVPFAERHESGLSEAHHVFELNAFGERAAETLGKGYDAEWQRGPRLDAVLNAQAILDREPFNAARLFKVEPDELGRAAADIEYQRIFGVPADERGAAGHGQAGFGLTSDDLKRKPRLALHARHEFRPVFCDAARLCGDKPRPRDSSAGHFRRAHLQSVDRAKDRIL